MMGKGNPSRPNPPLTRTTVCHIMGLLVTASSDTAWYRTQETGNNEVAFMELDLRILQSVRSFSESFLKSESRLDILINNTGGNTGIGKATALELARRGARVIMACRNQEKAELAISDIKRETGSTDVVYMQLDLGSLQAVRSFTETFLKTEARLDLLINNAGLVADGRTADGFGIEFGVNHLGHFLLTCLLLDRLKEGTGGRVVTLGSMAYRWGNIDFDALITNKHLGTGRYSWQFFHAYCNSKLCNVLFNHELAKRLKGTNVTCYSVHPGVVKTELSRNCSLWQRFIIEPIARLLFLDPESGAQTTLHCALQEGIEPLSGRYFFCCAPQDVVAKGKDDAVAKKLWEVSERLSGLF